MGSKSKGGSFENEVAKILSLWYSQGSRDDLFMRSQSSGARFTQRKKKGKDTAYQGGDITFSDPLGEPLIKRWNIEAKTGYSGRKKINIGNENEIKIEMRRWDVLDFIDSKQKEPVLLKMWNQCTRDADLTDREPILIFRRNNRSPCIAMDIDYEAKLIGWYGCLNDVRLSLDYELYHIRIMPIKDFFAWIPDISLALK